MKVFISKIIPWVIMIILLETQSVVPFNWDNIDIINKIRIIAGLTLMFFILIGGVFIFKSVWVREGYVGEDKLLVDKEVSLYVSHVIAFMLLEVFIFMITFYDYIEPPPYAFWICAAGFLPGELVMSLKAIVSLFKKDNVISDGNERR